MKIYGDINSGNCLKVKWVCDYSHEPTIAICRFQTVYLGRAAADLDSHKVERGYAALARMERQLASMLRMRCDCRSYCVERSQESPASLPQARLKHEAPLVNAVKQISQVMGLNEH